MGGFRLNMVSSHLSHKSGSLAAGFPTENTYKLGSRILWPSDKVIPVDGKILDGVSQLGVAPQCGRIWETHCFHRDWLAEKPKCLLEKSCELFFAMVFVAFDEGTWNIHMYIFTLIYLWTCEIYICIYVVAFGCVSKCCGFEDPSCICSSSLEHQIRFDLYNQERQWNLLFRAAAPALHRFDELVDNSLSLIPCEIQKKCHQKPAYCSRNDGVSFFCTRIHT